MRSEKTDALRNAIAEAVAAAFPQLADVVVELELPRDARFGDVSCNVAMKEARRLRTSPRKIAQQIAAGMSLPPGLVEGVQVEGPGFLNFTWSASCLVEELAAILTEGPAYGRARQGGRGRVQIEFVSANPTGPLNVVSARAAAVGDSLARLFERAGWRVEREFYVNDSGTQVGGLGVSTRAQYERLLGLGELPEDLPYRGAYLEDVAREALEIVRLLGGIADEAARETEMKRILQLYDGKADAPAPSAVIAQLRRSSGGASQTLARQPGGEDPLRAVDRGLAERFGGLLDFARFAVAANLEGQRLDLELLGVSFDSETGRERRGWFHESWLHRGAVDALEALFREKGLTREADGALWLRTSEHGDDEDRVIRRRTGESTYFLADLAYHLDKKRRGYDRVIDIWGPDHHGHVGRMHAGLRMAGCAEGWLTVIVAQQVNLLQDGQPVKMSKRAGEFVTLRELVEEVGRDVARFYFLMRRTSSHLDFDLGVARRESEENPIYYIEYAYARIRSIFEKAAGRGLDARGLVGRADLARLAEPEALELMKMLARYPEVVESCVAALDPHSMGAYLRELAQVFHRFYHQHRVLEEDEATAAARMALVEGVRVILGNGLDALGVEPPRERM